MEGRGEEKHSFGNFLLVWVIFGAITPSVFQECAPSLLSYDPRPRLLSDNYLRNISKKYSPILLASFDSLRRFLSRNKLLEIPSFNLDAERGTNGKELEEPAR